MQTVAITGGTGLVGTALGRALLQKGYHVIILTRKTGKRSATPNLSYASWDVKGMAIDKEAIASADHIVHLAGAGVAEKRWTKKRKQEIVDSRVNSSHLLAESLRTISNNVKTVVSASAIGWYGPDHNSKSFVETDLPANDFLGQTCKQWEESIEPVAELGKRLVKLRTGIVLSKNGGALKEFKKPMKFGIAAILGSGKQVISWIHINDLVSMYIAAIENDNMMGAYNAVAPNPVSNRELTLTLARNRQKFFIPIYVSSFILKVVLGEMSTEVLKSATVSPAKIIHAGFVFAHPLISDAIK